MSIKRSISTEADKDLLLVADIEKRPRITRKTKMNLIKNISYTFETSGKIGIFALNGELNAEHENDLSVLLMKAIYGIERAVVNLKEVTKISSPCLQLLNRGYCTSLRLRRPLILTEVPRKYISEMYKCDIGERTGSTSY